MFGREMIGEHLHAVSDDDQRREEQCEPGERKRSSRDLLLRPPERAEGVESGRVSAMRSELVSLEGADEPIGFVHCRDSGTIGLLS